MEVDDCSSQRGQPAVQHPGDRLRRRHRRRDRTTTTGTNPCASFCTNPTRVAQSFASGAIATTAACYETTASLGGAQQSNMTGRTFSINGTAFTSGTLPAKVNGGYCIQVGAGGLNYASFSTW